MPNNKARRVNIRHSGYLSRAGFVRDDPNGTHHLAPVDEYEVVKKGTLRNIESRLMEIVHHGDAAAGEEAGEIVADVRRALAEIGGGDGV